MYIEKLYIFFNAAAHSLDFTSSNWMYILLNFNDKK